MFFAGGEEIKEESDIEVPYLGADDVINEVLILLARLELDRQEIHKEYIKETEKVFTLQKKVDDLCLRRLKDLPVLVQRGRSRYYSSLCHHTFVYFRKLFNCPVTVKLSGNV